MKIASYFVLLSVLTLPIVTRSAYSQAPCVSATAATVDATVIKELQGKWHNDFLPEKKQSTLYIQKIDSTSGQITGTYTSPIGAGAVAYPLIGWVNTASPVSGADHVIAVSFTVRWEEIGTITSWTGFYGCPPADEMAEGTDKKPYILGQWNLADPNCKFRWGHIQAGQDRFHKFAEN